MCSQQSEVKVLNGLDGFHVRSRIPMACLGELQSIEATDFITKKRVCFACAKKVKTAAGKLSKTLFCRQLLKLLNPLHGISV